MIQCSKKQENIRLYWNL